MQTNVLSYLEATYPRCPDKIAYSDGTDALTFREVYSYSRAVGSYIAGRGVYGEPVAVLTKKHPRAIPCFFGAVYAGCSYVPVDMEMPRVRIAMILDNITPSIIICDEDTESAAREMADERGITAVLAEEIFKTPEDESALRKIRERQLDTDPIYIVFTSGSTGVPKGVAACHRSVIDYIENLSAALHFDGDSVFGNQAPLYFDACLKELYPTIKFGATAYLIPKTNFMFPTSLVAYLNEHKINTVCWVVSALTMISSTGTFDTVKPQYLKTVAFGSEVFPPSQLALWRKALPDTEFYNLYGPTECTGMSCIYHVTDELADEEVVPIGKPFPNTGILLYDFDAEGGASAVIYEEGKESECGEICIRGTPLTLGYYNDFVQTDRAFVQNPANTHYYEKIYRTGDIGRYNSRGELVFVSRRDHQIKHMGHRIELGELEYTIAGCPGVTNDCAVYDKNKSKIVLFYTGDAERAGITAFLKERLPRYMLPNTIIKLDDMPLTPNGKRDRVALASRLST